MKAGGIAGDQLRSIVERIERLEEEKKAIGEDIREVIVEAASNGFDVPTIRKVIRLRKLDKAEREKQEALLDLYLHALGMTPIEAAIERAGEAPPAAKAEGPTKGKRHGKARSPAAEFAADLAGA